MSEFRPSNDVPPPGRAARCNGIRDRMLVGLVLFTLVRASEALAGDQASITNATSTPDIGKFRLSSPSSTAISATPEALTPGTLALGAFNAPAVTDNPAFSATEFRPRKHTVFDSDPTVNSFGETPMLRGTTVWQRLAEYRSHDRVRVLTLWESSGSSVSLQAGKRGDPSLQWTSRLMNRGGSTQGLLDRLFSVSLARAGNGLRNATRPTNAGPTPTPSVPGVAGLK
jgi:hypothetical protein